MMGGRVNTSEFQWSKNHRWLRILKRVVFFESFLWTTVFLRGFWRRRPAEKKLVCFPNCPVDPTLGSTFDSTWIGALQDAGSWQIKVPEPKHVSCHLGDEESASWGPGEFFSKISTSTKLTRFHSLALQPPRCHCDS